MGGGASSDPIEVWRLEKAGHGVPCPLRGEGDENGPGTVAVTDCRTPGRAGINSARHLQNREGEEFFRGLLNISVCVAKSYS